MLTADLVRARIVKGEVRPRYVDPADPGLVALAESMIALYAEHVGRRRDDLDGALAALLGEGTDFLLHRGLAKLLLDRSEFEVRAPVAPAALRRALFEAAARSHPPALVADAVHTVTRDMIVAEVAAALEVPEGECLAAMYADLDGEQVLTAVAPVTATALLQRYNLALAQAVLLRATSLTLRVAASDPQRYRQLFRYIKFYRLMHAVTGTAATGYEITLDGPLSLFQLSQKYGLQLAEFLPALALCPSWTAQAEVLWGKDRKRYTLRVSSEDGLVSHYPDTGQYVTREEQWLLDRLDAVGGAWSVERRGEILDLDGRGVLIPDLALRHADGRVAWLEIVGFWKRDWLAARLALLRDAAPKNLILAVPWRLRGSDESLEETPVEVIFYKETILAKELLERAEKVALPTPGAPPKKRARRSAAKAH
ncbi:MAG: DUF790 family protein [Polyangiales bacterium]